MGLTTALLCAVCYALSYSFIRKGQSEGAPPDHGLLPILLISALTLDLAVVTMALHHPMIVTSGKSIHPLIFAVLSGIISTLIGRLLLYRAIHDLGATRGVVVKGLSPVATVAVVAFMLRQPVDYSDIIGLLALAIAVTLLLIERKLTPMRGFSLGFFTNGIALAAFAALSQGIGHAFRQVSVDGGIDPTIAAATDVTAACVGYLLILCVTGRLHRMFIWYVKHINLWLVAAGFSSSAAVMLFFAAVSLLPVTTVSLVVAVEPIFVTLFAVLFFPTLERLTWWSASASIVVAGGIILMNL